MDFIAGTSIVAKKRKPNFLVVLIDDLRFDELGICGHPFMKTPHIDRIGHEGAFRRGLEPLWDEMFDWLTAGDAG